MAPSKKTLALKHKDFLTLLGNSKQRKRRNALIELGTNEEIDSISECILNILQGKVKLKSQEIKKLQKIKQYLRLLANKKCSIKKRKTLFKQKGGLFFKNIVSAIISLAKKKGGSLLKN